MAAKKSKRNSEASADLCSAARKGDTKLALELIQQGADVNYNPPMGTPLENAVRVGALEIMRALVAAGADANHQGYLGSVLTRAVETKKPEVVEELVRLGANVNLQPKFGVPALLTAVQRKESPMVEVLLRLGADPNAKGCASVGDFGEPVVTIEGGCRITHVPNPEFVKELTPLILATREKLPDIVSKLIAGRADLEAVDSNGFTALAYAMKAKDEAMIQLLTEAGAKPPQFVEGSRELAWITAAKNGTLQRLLELLAAGVAVDAKYSSSTDPEEVTALAVAAEQGRLEIVRWLLQQGATVDEPCGNSGEDAKRTALMHAARGGNVEVVTALIEAGATVTARDKCKATPLHYAAEFGHDDVIRLLVKAGAQVDATGRAGTPLMVAAGGGLIDAVRALLELKANPNAKTKDGYTALFNAAGEGHAEVVKALLAAGADVAGGGAGITPLEVASTGGHQAVVALLVKAQQNSKSGPAASKSDGEALLSAVMSGKAEVIQTLLDAGADPNAKNVDSFTPLMAAVRVGNVELVTLLLQAKAEPNVINDRGETALDLAYDGIKLAKDQLVFLKKFGGEKEKKEAAELAKQIKATEGEDEITSALREAGGKRGKELKRPRAPKAPTPEPQSERSYDDLPVPDFRARAKAADFKKAVQELAKLCGTKARLVADEDEPFAGCAQFTVTTEKADQIIADHHEAMLKRGCYLIKSSRGFASGKDQLTLLPTNNRNEVLAAAQTNGANSDVYPADVVRWFEELEKSQPFLLTGAGHDWCEGRFTSPLKDSKKLAKEIYGFCSDIVDQGVGDVARLALELKKTQRFFFWWD